MTGLGEDVWNGEVPSASSDDFAALRRVAEAAKDDPEADCEMISMIDSEFVLALLDRLEKAEAENSALKKWSDQLVLSETEELGQDLAAAYRALAFVERDPPYPDHRSNVDMLDQQIKFDEWMYDWQHVHMPAIEKARAFVEGESK